MEAAQGRRPDLTSTYLSLGARQGPADSLPVAGFGGDYVEMELGHGLAGGDWVFVLDAGEEVIEDEQKDWLVRSLVRARLSRRRL